MTGWVLVMAGTWPGSRSPTSRPASPQPSTATGKQPSARQFAVNGQRRRQEQDSHSHSHLGNHLSPRQSIQERFSILLRDARKQRDTKASQQGLCSLLLADYSYRQILDSRLSASWYAVFCQPHRWAFARG